MLGLARIIILTGIILILIGGGIYLAARFGIPLGRLPGDIRVENENFSIYFPLGTMILLSILLTILLNVIVRLFNK